MAENGQFFPDAVKTEFSAVGNAMARLYSALSAEAYESGFRLWKFTPKVHLVIHLVEDQTCFGNPAYFWCYPDEDLVGLSVEVGSSCHPRTLVPTSLVKWLIIAFDVEDGEE